MCNAHNHPHDCSCGFGGEGHLGGGGYGGLKNNGQKMAIPFLFNDLEISEYIFPFDQRKNYFIRNSFCPVCGQEVFFYKSENGGRVFFDELGPPWPKHPCTDGKLNLFSLTKIPLRDDLVFSFLKPAKLFEILNPTDQEYYPIRIQMIKIFKEYTLVESREIGSLMSNFKFLIHKKFNFLEDSLVYLKQLNDFNFHLAFYFSTSSGVSKCDFFHLAPIEEIDCPGDANGLIKLTKLISNSGKEKGLVLDFLERELGISVPNSNFNKTKVAEVILDFVKSELS